MATANRAKVGGEVGKNGEFYAGGTFLPNTTLTKMANTRKAGAGRVEVEPYVWVAANGRKPILPLLKGVIGTIGRDGIAAITASHQTLTYFGYSREEAQRVADRYNAGERWM
jgi:hypothetical protein